MAESVGGLVNVATVVPSVTAAMPMAVVVVRAHLPPHYRLRVTHDKTCASFHPQKLKI